MASLNHATIIKGFEKLAGDRDPENFFFDFLKILKFSAATIKRLKMANGNRNVAVLQETLPWQRRSIFMSHTRARI